MGSEADEPPREESPGPTAGGSDKPDQESKAQKGPAKLRGPSRKGFLGPYEMAIALTLLVLWLIPITYVGAMQKDFRFGFFNDWKWLRHQQRISCLFTNAATVWADYYVQVQSGGSQQWTELSEDGYFEMPVFGFRSRMHRILGHSYGKARGDRRITEIANFIRKRYKTLNPSAPQLDAVRFVRGSISSKELAKQTGCYKKLTLEQLNTKSKRYFGETRWDGKRPAHPGNGKSKRSAKTRRRPTRGNEAAPRPAPSGSSTSGATQAPTSSASPSGLTPAGGPP
jgi:hypothetical protein